MRKITNSTPIVRYDLIGNVIAEYNSISEAASKLKCQISGISNVLRDKSPMYKKSIWRYKDDSKNIISAMIRKRADEEAEEIKRELEEKYNRFMFPVRYAKSFSFVKEQREKELLEKACQEAYKWGNNN